MVSACQGQGRTDSPWTKKQVNSYGHLCIVGYLQNSWDHEMLYRENSRRGGGREEIDVGFEGETGGFWIFVQDNGTQEMMGRSSRETVRS